MNREQNFCGPLMFQPLQNGCFNGEDGVPIILPSAYKPSPMPFSPSGLGHCPARANSMNSSSPGQIVNKTFQIFYKGRPKWKGRACVYTAIAVFFLVAFIGLYTPAQAQVEAKDKVEIRMNSHDIANAIYQFDVPFNLVGPVPPGTRKILFSYKVSNDKKWEKKDGSTDFPNWITLPVRHPDGSFFKSATWINSGSDQNFTLHCPGMHPNMKYDFFFEIIKDPNVDDKARAALKKKLSETILAFYEVAMVDGFDPGDLADLNNNLLTLLKAEFKIDCDGVVELREKCNDQNRYVVDVAADPDINNAYSILTGLSATRKNALDVLFEGTNTVGQLVTALREHQQLILDTIDILLADKTALTKFSKAILEQPFNPSLDAFRAYTLKDGLQILRKLALVPDHLAAIFKGDEKIVNKDFVASDKVDVPTLRFLYRLLHYLSENIMQYVENGKLITVFYVHPPVAEGQLAPPPNKYEEILQLLGTSFDAALELAKATDELEVGKTTFPDLVANIVQFQSLAADVISLADVSTNKTPYISAEGGIGYSTSFQNAFSYYGANFYLTPVNKKAPLKTFRGWNLVKKMMCVNLGISNFFGKRPADSYSILGDDSGSDLLIGLGVRTGRVVKINFDWMPYKTNRSNPLAAGKIIKADFIISIGADINLLSAFSNVAKALRLIQ